MGHRKVGVPGSFRAGLRGAALNPERQGEPACSTPAPQGGVLKRATAEAVVSAPPGPPPEPPQVAPPFCVCLGGAFGEPHAGRLLGEWCRPLILAQALTCSTFLWGPSQLCLSDSSWECSQGRPRPPVGGMGEVEGRGGLLRALGNPESFSGGKSRTSGRASVSSREGPHHGRAWLLGG